MTAVKQRRISLLGYDEVAPDPRGAEAVVKIAELIHLRDFDLPADHA
jgi:hypothetical protein